MELKWLEDFVSLAETGNFSRSAVLRHVTQPAFSRRIQALETWLGADLVDRTSFPTTLTPAGKAFKEHAAEVLRGIYDARAVVRGSEPIPADTLRFAMPHALSLGFYPKWLSRVERAIGGFGSKLDALNVHDAVLALVEGHCDLLICYHHEQQPIQLDEQRYDMLLLDKQIVRPYAKLTSGGEPLYRLPGSAEHPVPYLAYSPNAYIARIVDMILERSRIKPYLHRRFETDMAEALKTMAIEGHGIAWLPDNTIKGMCQSRCLVVAGDENWFCEIEIRLYRDLKKSKPLVERLWKYLAKHGYASQA